MVAKPTVPPKACFASYDALTLCGGHAESLNSTSASRNTVSSPLSPSPSLPPTVCVCYMSYMYIYMCYHVYKYRHALPWQACRHQSIRCQSSPVWVRVLVQHCIRQPHCSVSFLGFSWFVLYCLSQREHCQCRRVCPALSQSLGSHAYGHSALPMETSPQPRKCIWSMRPPSEANTIRVW